MTKPQMYYNKDKKLRNLSINEVSKDLEQIWWWLPASPLTIANSYANSFTSLAELSIIPILMIDSSKISAVSLAEYACSTHENSHCFS